MVVAVAGGQVLAFDAATAAGGAVYEGQSPVASSSCTATPATVSGNGRHSVASSEFGAPFLNGSSAIC